MCILGFYHLVYNVSEGIDMSNQKIIVNNILYCLCDSIELLDDSSNFLVVEDEYNNRKVCTKSFFDEHRVVEKTESSINRQSSIADKIMLMRSLFKCRDDVFAERWENQSTGAVGYSFACDNKWSVDNCTNRKIKCKDCTNRCYSPLTDYVIATHMKGWKENGFEYSIGIYPLLLDNTSFFIVADFDEKDYLNDAKAFKNVCNQNGFYPSFERSRSGNGIHAWFFFSERIQVSLSRKFVSILLTMTMNQYADLKLSSYDRLIPNQDILPKGGLGNIIALPLQGKMKQKGNTLFLDDLWKPYDDQIAYLSSIERISKNQIEKWIATNKKISVLGELKNDELKPWENYDQYQISPLDFPSDVSVVLSNGIYIERNGISNYALNKIKRFAAFYNRDFYKAQRMGLSTKDKSRVIDLSEMFQNYIKLPRGCIDDVISFIPNYSITDLRQKGKQIDFCFHGELKEKQVEAANALIKYDNGVLSAVTGFGKTVIGMYVIYKKKVNTLILVHATSLLSQWIKAIKTFLGIDAVPKKYKEKNGLSCETIYVGQLGNGKNCLTGVIDIALIQSLAKAEYCNKIVSEYGMVIVDECHHVSADSFEKVMSYIRSKYVYGLSATPYRSDGKSQIIFMHCGPIRYKVDTLIEAMSSPFERFLIPRFTSSFISDEGMMSYPEIIDFITNDEERNALIIEDVKKAIRNHRTPIILTERRSHAEFLKQKLLGTADHIILLLGGGTSNQKKEQLNKLKGISSQETFIIVATGKYVGEGFDEPRLDTLFLTIPVAWKGKISQYVGRIHRNYEGKKEVHVYDYIDMNIEKMRRMYRKRMKGYVENHYCVKEDSESYTSQVIYSNDDYFTHLIDDIKCSHNSIFISMSTIKIVAFKKFESIICRKLDEGVKIIISVFDYENGDNYKDIDFDRRITINHTTNYQQFIIIDNDLVWYGTINIFSMTNKNQYLIRIHNQSLITELLKSLCLNEHFE